MATVSPIPQVGTELICVATTNDPANPSAPPDIQPTNASGVVTFLSLDLGSFGIPPIAVGSTLTLTVSFVDTATFGLATCVQNWLVEACS